MISGPKRAAEEENNGEVMLMVSPVLGDFTHRIGDEKSQPMVNLEDFCMVGILSSSQMRLTRGNGDY